MQEQVAEENGGEEVTRSWGKSHNGLEDLYFLINSVRMFK
jgi:hypothetical protein